MNRWPLQSECDAFYGDPRGRMGQASQAWEAAHLVYLEPPFPMTFAGKPCKRIRVHRKVETSLARVLADIKRRAEQASVDHKRLVGAILRDWGVSIYGGAYNYRIKRGGSRLSMHAYGCAIDLDPVRNAFHDTTPHFAEVPAVVEAFEREGWIWGGRWSGRSCDGMHFQAARVG